jgi:hypothetical protein
LENFRLRLQEFEPLQSRVQDIQQPHRHPCCNETQTQSTSHRGESRVPLILFKPGTEISKAVKAAHAVLFTLCHHPDSFSSISSFHTITSSGFDPNLFVSSSVSEVPMKFLEKFGGKAAVGLFPRTLLAPWIVY